MTTYEAPQPLPEHLEPLAPGEEWEYASQDPSLEEVFLRDKQHVVLSPQHPIELPEAFDHVPAGRAKDPLAIVYAGNPRTEDNRPKTSWESGTMFVIYGKSLSSEKLHPDDPDDAIKKVGMRDVPRVFQVDTLQGTATHVGSLKDGILVVGRAGMPRTSTPNVDMSRSHFTLIRTQEGNIALMDHSKNGTAVLRAEQPNQLSQTKEYTVAHNVGHTIGNAEFQQ